MSTKWADVVEEEDADEGASPKSGARFETSADDQGIKTVIEYVVRDGKTFKVSKRVRQTTISRWTNQAIAARKPMPKFGKAANASAAEEAQHIQQSNEEIAVELTRKPVSIATVNDAEDKFLEESSAICGKLTVPKQVWTDINREKQSMREIEEPSKGNVTAGAAGASLGPSKYVPPSLRDGKGDAKGNGKGDQQLEGRLRIANLSEDVREGDLRELFGRFGRLQRVFLPKDQQTGLCRGFAFVTYYNKVDAELAIAKMHGHGYDNLIMQVMWAKPRA